MVLRERFELPTPALLERRSTIIAIAALFGSPPRIRTETFDDFEPIASASWASGPYMVSSFYRSDTFPIFVSVNIDTLLEESRLL